MTVIDRTIYRWMKRSYTTKEMIKVYTPTEEERRFVSVMARTAQNQLNLIPHVWFVGGFSGHGMPFGLRFGQLLAETVVNGTIPSALKPFRLSRPTLKRWKLDARDAPQTN